MAATALSDVSHSARRICAQHTVCIAFSMNLCMSVHMSMHTSGQSSGLPQDDALDANSTTKKNS